MREMSGHEFGHEYTVEFRIFSATLDPAEITRELGLQPCQVKFEGTPALGSTRGRLLEGMWAYDGGDERIDWQSLSDGLTFMLDKLWPHREAIARYETRGELIFWCGNFQSSFDGGPTFSPDLLKRLGEFGAELYMDNYFSANSELL
jgi:hypothetical protein